MRNRDQRFQATVQNANASFKEKEKEKKERQEEEKEEKKEEGGGRTWRGRGKRKKEEKKEKKEEKKKEEEAEEKKKEMKNSERSSLQHSHGLSLPLCLRERLQWWGKEVETEKEGLSESWQEMRELVDPRT